MQAENNNDIAITEAKLKDFLSSVLSSEGIVVDIRRTFIEYNGVNRSRVFARHANRMACKGSNEKFVVIALLCYPALQWLLKAQDIDALIEKLKEENEDESVWRMSNIQRILESSMGGCKPQLRLEMRKLFFARCQQLVDEIELLDGAAEEFDLDRVLRGELSPVFFGSALTNFGVEPFLENFLRLTPTPLARVDSLTGEAVDPCRDEFSAFIFKIQANMNKAHRDRIAFMRICSGKFERGMEAYHVQEGKNIKLATGTQLMAQDRAIVDEAYAGDIIGLFDPGIFSIGDTLCTGKKKVEFAGIPTFSPEHFARIEQKDTMKRKQFVKGMEQIAQEGAIQIFREVGGGMEEVVVGVVGVLQLEVLEYRLNTEYNVEIRMQQLPFEQLRWIQNDPDTYVLRDLDLTSDTKAVEDMKGSRLLLFTSDWAIRWAETHNETLKLSEFGNI